MMLKVNRLHMNNLNLEIKRDSNQYTIKIVFFECDQANELKDSLL